MTDQLLPDIQDSIDRVLPYAVYSQDEREFTYAGLVYCGECKANIETPSLMSHALLRGSKRFAWYYRCKDAGGYNDCMRAKEIAVLLEEHIDVAVADHIFGRDDFRAVLRKALLEPWNEFEEAIYEERTLLTDRNNALMRKLIRFNNSHLASSLSKVYRGQLEAINDRLKEFPSERQPLTMEKYDALYDNVVAQLRAGCLPDQWKRAIARPLVKKVTIYADRHEIEFYTRR